MERLVDRILRLIGEGRSQVSEHGFRELEEDGIKLSNILSGMANAVIVEEYPDYLENVS